MQSWLEALGEDVGELLGGCHPDESEVSKLHCFVGKVLSNVNVFGTLTSSDDIVSPLDAGRVVLIYRRW
jgi:hypothetical protein